MNENSESILSANPHTKELNLLEVPDDTIICSCMGLKRREILELAASIAFAKSARDRHDINLSKLISRSGAGSVCSMCHPLLRESIGEISFTPVILVSIESICNDVKRFRFKSLSDTFPPARAGQYVSLQANIDGQWQQRNYTLTTPENENSYREITVKRQFRGFFSNWLHAISLDAYDVPPVFRMSPPLGGVIPNQVKSYPLVCIVGGIGITPVISLLRSISRRHDDRYRYDRKVIVDYSTPAMNSIVLKEGLDEITSNNKNIDITYRLTRDVGRIGARDIENICRAYPNAEYYLCGTEGFLTHVKQFLGTQHIDEKLIRSEGFFVSEAPTIQSSRSYLWIGTILLSAFLLQNLLELKWTYLETLQSDRDYKIYSGLLLYVYLVSMFVLPYDKNCKQPHSSAGRYFNHKIRGALIPLVFYVHSTHFGVGYLSLLSILLPTNVLVGLLNHERITTSKWRLIWFKWWLPIHIVLSINIIVLSTYHAFVISSFSG